MIPSLKIRSDPVINRLILNISGEIAVTEAKRFKRDLSVELARLKPGFTLLIDARDFKPITNNTQRVIEGIMEAIVSAKPSKVARIVSSSPGIKMGKVSRKAGYLSAAFETEMEAERFLDQ